MKNGVIYVRVSTEEQAKEGQSIDAQINLCQSYAKDNKIKIIQIFKDEGKSATNLRRPGLQLLLEEVSDGKNIECVLIQDTDRLARNTLDHLTLKALFRKHGTKLISISQPMIDDSPEGRFIDVVLAGANALQSQITGRKTSKVMEQKVKAGWWAGWAPYGYKNVKNPKPPTSGFDKRIVVPDSKYAPLIKQMFEFYTTGNYSIQSLIKKMTSLGLKTGTDKPLYISHVHQTLKNPFYYGALPWKGKIYKGLHKPLISKTAWNKVQQIMAEHNQHASRSRKHDFLLRGFLYCSDCHSRFWAGPHKGRNGIINYYFCKQCKKGTYTEAKEIEKQINKWFGYIEVTPQYTKELKEEAKKLTKELRKLRISEERAYVNRKTSLKDKMESTEDRLIDGTLNKNQFRRIYDRLEEEMNVVEDELLEVSNKYDQNMNGIISLVDMAVNIKQTYRHAIKSEKRNYISLFFDKFLVKDGKITKAIPSKTLKPVLKTKKILVRVRGNWLPGLDSNQ
jgi:site-specific DNA recombinase